MSLLLLLALSCPKTVIINDSGLPWNDHDEQMLSQSKTRCKELYSDAPCVKKFYKKEEQNYWVICGVMEK